MANKNETRRPSSGLLFYGLMLVVLVVLASVFWGSNYGTREQNTLSDVLQTINSEDNDVSMVEVNGTTVTVKYKASGAQYESEMTQQVPYEYVDDLIEKLEKAKDAGQIKDLIDELRGIIQHDPFMESSDRIRLLGFRHKRKFLYECFVYTLTHKGNTGRRPKRKEARRIQVQAQKNTERISNAVQVLYDEETADENTDEGQ